MHVWGDEHFVRLIRLHDVPVGLHLAIKTTQPGMSFQTSFEQCPDGSGGSTEMMRILANVEDGICPVFEVNLVAETDAERTSFVDAAVYSKTEDTSTTTQASFLITSGSILQIYTDMEAKLSFHQPVRM